MSGQQTVHDQVDSLMRPKGSEGTGLRALLGLVIVVACLAGAFNVALDVKNELDLRERGQTARATVTGAVVRSRYVFFRSYAVAYQFDLSGRAYAHDSSLARNYHNLMGTTDRRPSSLWIDVPQPAWTQAKSQRWIDVLYLPGNPWINRPVAALGGLLDLSIPHVLETGALIILAALGIGMLADALVRSAG